MENIQELIEYPKKGIHSLEVKRSGALDVTLFCMAGGSEMSEHTSTKEGFVHVIEGNGVFVLEGEEIEMKKGVFIYMEKNAKHSLRAIENTSFVLVLNA